MKDLTRRIIAWTGLIFMAAFIVSLILSFVAPSLFDGKISYAAIAFFILAIVPFALIYFDNRDRRAREAEENAEKMRRDENRKKRLANAEKQKLENQQFNPETENSFGNSVLPVSENSETPEPGDNTSCDVSGNTEKP